MAQEGGYTTVASQRSLTTELQGPSRPTAPSPRFTASRLMNFEDVPPSFSRADESSLMAKYPAPTKRFSSTPAQAWSGPAATATTAAGSGSGASPSLVGIDDRRLFAPSNSSRSGSSGFGDMSNSSTESFNTRGPATIAAIGPFQPPSSQLLAARTNGIPWRGETRSLPDAGNSMYNNPPPPTHSFLEGSEYQMRSMRRANEQRDRDRERENVNSYLLQDAVPYEESFQPFPSQSDLSRGSRFRIACRLKQLKDRRSLLSRQNHRSCRRKTALLREWLQIAPFIYLSISLSFPRTKIFYSTLCMRSTAANKLLYLPNLLRQSKITFELTGFYNL